MTKPRCRQHVVLNQKRVTRAEGSHARHFRKRNLYLRNDVCGIIIASPLSLEIEKWKGHSRNKFLSYLNHVNFYRFIPRCLQLTDIEVILVVREDAQKGLDYNLGDLTCL